MISPKVSLTDQDNDDTDDPDPSPPPTTQGQMVKFIPISTTTEPSFWIKLGEYKLNVIKLSESPLHDIVGTILHNNVAGTGGRLRLDQQSLSSLYKQQQVSQNRNESIRMKGSMIILNTMESFRTTNKNDFLDQAFLPQFFTSPLNQQETNISQTICHFTCLAYLDLKHHKVVYWFAFPSLVPRTGKAVRYDHSEEEEEDQNGQRRWKDVWVDVDRRCRLRRAFWRMRRDCFIRDEDDGCPPYFLIVEGGDTEMKCLSFTPNNYQSLSEDEKSNCIFGFMDPSSSTSSDQHDDHHENLSYPLGWTMRNLVAYLSIQLHLGGSVISVLSYRPGILRRITSSEEEEDDYVQQVEDDADSSLLLRIILPQAEDYIWNDNDSTDSTKQYKCTGWELNTRAKPGPRSINLSDSLSPSNLSSQATNLNLRLMKWRMLPTLNLDLLADLKVLLLGSGTLGCAVARTLLGWGVRHYTFVDNGRVSYSNPSRQCLFELTDCEDGGKHKAMAAAAAMLRIAGASSSPQNNSGLVAKGVDLTIPMPGHPFAPNGPEETTIKNDIQRLDQLFRQSDVVFLLTDTRESRWLPTVLARTTDTMLINAALGLDSWLVMRHGGNKTSDSSSSLRLGCYFCNDVVAPENSTNNRTLDQQCTVTRPGLSPIASAMACELMVSLLHHPLRQDAAAPTPKPQSSSTNHFSPLPPQQNTPQSTSPLGVLPHQIRGSIVTYTLMTPTVPAFPYCTGCSDNIIHEFQKSPLDMVKRVCGCTDGSYLENVTGLKDFRDGALDRMDDSFDWDDDDEEQAHDDILE